MSISWARNFQTPSEALQALELCLRFFAASTIADFEQIRTQAGAVVDQHPRPIDPLEFLALWDLPWKTSVLLPRFIASRRHVRKSVHR